MCGMPLGFGAVGCLLGGPLTDRLVRTWGWRRGRCPVGFVAMVVFAALLVLATHMKGPWSAMIVIGFSTLIKDLYMVPSSGRCADIGGKYAGTVAGFMNMTGNLGGVVAPLVMGFILQQSGSNTGTWDYLFYMFAAVNVVGGILWLYVDPTKPVVGERTVRGPGISGRAGVTVFIRSPTPCGPQSCSCSPPRRLRPSPTARSPSSAAR